MGGVGGGGTLAGGVLLTDPGCPLNPLCGGSGPFEGMLIGPESTTDPATQVLLVSILRKKM